MDIAVEAVFEKEEVKKRFEQLETQLEVQKLWILASAGSRSLLT